MASAAPALYSTGQIEQSVFLSYIRRPLETILSFEFVLACLINAGAFKRSPTFGWLFPIDGTIIFFTITVLMAGLFIFQHGMRAHTGLPIGLYILFCLWTLASMSWTKATGSAPFMDFILRVPLINGVIFISALSIVARGRVRTLRFLAATALLSLPLAVDYIVHAGGLAHRGELDDRNYALIGRAVAIGFATFFGFMVYMKPVTVKWALCLAAAATLFYASLIIGSRQSFLIMMGQMGIVLLMATYVTRRSILIQVGLVPALLLAILLVASLVLLIESGLESWTLRRMSRLTAFLSGDVAADQSTLVRVHYLEAALHYWSDSWQSILFGDGLFSFSQQYRGEYRPGTHPHNLVAAILCEFGLVGLTIFLLVAVSLLVPGKLHIERASPLAAVLIALAVGTTIRAAGSGDMEDSFVPLVYLSLFASLMEPTEQEAESEEEEAVDRAGMELDVLE